MFNTKKQIFTIAATAILSVFVVAFAAGAVTTIGNDVSIGGYLTLIGSGATNSVVFEGATADTFETTLAVIDPTDDRIITFQDVTGTVYVSTGTDVAVVDGGTGASTAAGARTNLGLVIGTNVQAWDTDLDAYAVVTPTTAGLALLDDADAAAQRTTLELVPGTNVQAYDATLLSIAGLGAANKMLYTTGVDTWAEAAITAAGLALLDDADAATQRATLGLGALSTLAVVSGGTGGTITDGTILNADINTAAAIAYSKLNITDADLTIAKTNGLQAALDGKQASDATLTSIALLGTTANKMAYTTNVDTWAEAAITTAGLAILDDADAATQRATLGLGALSTLAVVSGGTGGTIADNTITVADLAATLSFADGDFLDLNAINVSSATEGLIVPQAASCAAGTANGQLCWDNDTFILYAGNGTAPVAVGDAPVVGANNTWSGTNAFNGEVIFGSSGNVSYTGQTISIADGGAGITAYTLTPSSSHVRITCNDAEGCNITLSENGAADGQMLHIVNYGVNISNFADTAGVSELANAFAAGQNDSISLVYASDRWVELSRSNN